MKFALPMPDIQTDDTDDRLKEQLLLAAERGWHCPRDVSIVDRIEKFIDPAAQEYDAGFSAYLTESRQDWLFDLGRQPDVGSAIRV